MTTTEPVFFNPLEEGYLDNPWPHRAEIREHDPVHHLLTGQWGLFRYDDTFTLLRDPNLSVDDKNVDMDALERAALFEDVDPEEYNRSILNIDPPDHTRLRRLVSKAFTPRTIEALRPMVQRMVDEMLDQMEADGDADVVDRLAFPLPFDVISEMLGMPEADKDLIRDWSAAIVKTIDPIITEEEIAAAMDADEKMGAHLDKVIEWKTANPGDDLLTLLIEAEDDGDTMTARELRDPDGRDARPHPRERGPARFLRVRDPLLPRRVAGEARSPGRDRELREAVRSGRDRGRAEVERPHQPARPRRTDRSDRLIRSG